MEKAWNLSYSNFVHKLTVLFKVEKVLYLVVNEGKYF